MRAVFRQGAMKYHKPGEEGTAQAPEPKPESAAHPPQPSRHQRRRAKAFNRRLNRRLQKLSADGQPVSIEMLPDGGVHVKVHKPKSDS